MRANLLVIWLLGVLAGAIAFGMLGMVTGDGWAHGVLSGMMGIGLGTLPLCLYADWIDRH